MNGFENPPQTEKKEGKTLLDRIRSSVQQKMQESRLPTKEALGYESTVGVYGGKVNYDASQRMIFDMRGTISKADRLGDAILRTYDEHTVKNPVEMLKRHPHWFFRFLAPGTKRYRGTPEEIVENVKRLGLETAYGAHEWGIEIKDPDIYRAGRPLQDIYRADMIEGGDLNEVDRFEALNQSARYIRDIHEKYGAIGEVLPSDIIFRKKDGTIVSEPILNVPDIIYNAEKQTGEIDKMTTDLLDFMMSIGIEELRRSGDWNEAQKAVRIILDAYDDKNAVEMLKSFIKRGRLTMQGDEEGLDLSKTMETLRPLTAIHNKARLNFEKDTTSDLRKLIVAECENYLEDSIELEPDES